MPEIPGSYVELGRMSQRPDAAAHSARTSEAAGVGHPPLSGDQITQPERSGRHSKLPSFKSIAQTVIGAAVGAGTYRLAEFAAQRNSRPHLTAAPAPAAQPAHADNNGGPHVPAALPGYEQIGELHVNRTILNEFRDVAAVMEQDPKTNQTLQFLLNAKPNFLGNRLSVDPAGSQFDPITNSIYWDPKEKYAVPISNSSEVLGGLSPLGILTHQALHARHAAENFPGLTLRLACPDPNYQNKEERLTTEQANVQLANFPGEAQRWDDHYSVTLPAANVTDNSLSGFNTSQPQINATVDKLEDISRGAYSEADFGLPISLAALYDRMSTSLGYAGSLRSYFPNSFNNTNIVKITALADEGRNLAVAYDTARKGFDVPAALIEADANYTRRVNQFANDLHAQS